MNDRERMWQNFFYACDLGTVVVDYCNTVWQKKGKDYWQSVGDRDLYTATSIAWPVKVLQEGLS